MLGLSRTFKVRRWERCVPGSALWLLVFLTLFCKNTRDVTFY